MKSSDFRRSKSKIRVLEEVRPGKKKINWDRLIYLSLLLWAAAAVILMVAKKNLYVKGEGQILFKKLDIQYTQDMQILKFLREEGDSVNIGDTLFLFYDESAITSTAQFVSQEHITNTNSDQLNWIMREKLTTEKRIEIAQIQINDLRRLTDITNGEKNKVEQQVYLDVYPASKMDPFINKLSDIETNISMAQEEIKYYREYLIYLENQEALERENMRFRNKSHGGTSSKPGLSAYISPVSGVITRIYKENFEVALESHIIMSIHKPTNLYIKAFFDQKDLPHMKEGDLVEITFPDKSTSHGQIQRFYFATYRVPEEFQKKYAPTTRGVVADVTAIGEFELEKWKAFYKLNVEITKPKYEFW